MEANNRPEVDTLPSIVDGEVRIPLDRVMNMRPEEFKELRMKLLEDFAVHRLQEMITCLQEGNYARAREMLAVIPAGEERVLEGYFLNFATEEGHIADLEDVIHALEKYRLHGVLVNHNRKR